MADLDPLIRAYYERGEEADRLLGGFPSGPLELARTQELILRHMPDGRCAVVDVGGGPGVYAAWLASLGHDVHLVDPVELHVEQARATSAAVTAEVGDARSLAGGDDTADVVLLLGPLYHLVERTDRLQALNEARRVLRPGGVLFAAAIGRFAALLNLLAVDMLGDPAVLATVEDALATGVFRGAENDLFTTAYFHRPSDLRSEVAEVGFTVEGIYNIEGPGFLLADFDQRWRDPHRREAILHVARLVETEATMLGAASHLLAIART